MESPAELDAGTDDECPGTGDVEREPGAKVHGALELHVAVLVRCHHAHLPHSRCKAGAGDVPQAPRHGTQGRWHGRIVLRRDWCRCGQAPTPWYGLPVGRVSPTEGSLRQRVDAIEWYHTLELAPGVVTPGWFDTRSVVPRLPIPTSLEGMRCLDIGTFDGFWSFEMERRGASVTAIDVLDPRDWDWPLNSPAEAVDAIGHRKGEGTGFEIARGAHSTHTSNDWCATSTTSIPKASASSISSTWAACSSICVTRCGPSNGFGRCVEAAHWSSMRSISRSPCCCRERRWRAWTVSGDHGGGSRTSGVSSAWSRPLGSVP